MRRTTVLLLSFALLLACGGAARAQDVVVKMAARQAGQAPDQAPQADVQKALEAARHLSIDLKAASSGMLGEVVAGAPYSALTTNESVQTLADGNRIVHKSAYNVARDGQGRVRREELADNGAVSSIMIMDPVANTSYVLDPTTRTARKASLLINKQVVVSRVQSTAGGAVVIDGINTIAVKPAEPLPLTFEFKTKAPSGGAVYSFGEATFVTASATAMEYRNESLGTQMMEGVAADGMRSVGTIPAGQMGNERPIEIVTEQWYSKDLKMTVMSRRADPRSGETIYRVSGIRRGEPDPSLFQVPADYTVK
jgi:hypothetical protein